MKKFAGKTVLITGASMGIGAEFARQLAAKGANLILTARSQQLMQQLADELTQKYAASVLIYPADLSQSAAVKELVSRLHKDNLTVDVLINNAGFGKWGYFEESGTEIYEQMITLNMTSLVALTRSLTPDLLASGNGAIINVASVAGFQPVPFFSVYAATKAFVLSFSQALAKEYRDRGVRVLALCPGATDTQFQDTAGTGLSKIKQMDSSEHVVYVGLRALAAGKTSVVPGARNVLIARTGRLFTQNFLAKMAYRMFQPEDLPQVTE